MKRNIVRLALLVFVPLLLLAQDLKEFEKRVTEFTLANGLHFIVLERHQAPVVSFHSYVNAGAVNDPSGATGLAHMFEHMAFKGTETIGTRNYVEERKALDEVEQIYDKLEAERNKRFDADPAKIRALEAQLKVAIGKANSYVEPNAFFRIIEENGGVGLNASTGEDATRYYYNLPANRIELWFLLESRRFLQPVFREFYKERDVVREERRMRVESSPQGKLFEMLLATAFAAHPYRNMPGGWASDIESLRVSDARQFFKTYYVPNNITVGIAGDVDPVEIRRLADKYFSRLPSAPPPPRVHTVEPKQEGKKRATVESPSQPFLLIGYKRPNQLDKDDAVFDVVSGILSSGRTGMLYKDLVRDKKIALAAMAQAAFPAGKYPNLFVFFIIPSVGHTVEENQEACSGILEQLKKEKVDDITLQRVKTKVRASLIRQLDSNSGMAAHLTFFQVNYGDWRKLFTGLQEIDKVTADDVQRVAREYFVDDTRTVAYTVKPETGAEK
jgi:predicted Zn-dependent peptidase